MELNKLRMLAGINIQTPSKLSSADSNIIRKLAGLPVLPEEKEEPAEEVPSENTEVPAEEVPVDSTEVETEDEVKPEKTPEEEKEELISKIASHLEGKTADEISAMLHQIYDAGFADAQKVDKASDTSDLEKSE